MEPYYTRTVLPIAEWRHTEIPTADRPPANQAKVLRTLLHQYSITYRRIQIPRVDRPPPLVIKPKCTEPYYTRTVTMITECRCTEIPRVDRHPLLIDSKFMEPYYTRTILPIAEWRHTEIPTADRSLLIKPKC